MSDNNRTELKPTIPVSRNNETARLMEEQHDETETSTSGFLVVVSYPFVILLGYLFYITLTASGLHLMLATYTAVISGALLITFHEMYFPYRNEWRPPFGEVRADAMFLVTVQVALPYLLSFALVLTIARAFENGGLTISNLWPHELPIIMQTILMLVLADFLRYWLHRAFHRFVFMWRLHAVHHSPHRLYWLNVGRFHPLEKAVQYALDTLPFAVLAVSQEVLATYFIFYALNGFFQHSNCRVRLGLLNYIIAGPELHRWHHSAAAEESNHNFGNNLIIWDLLFGTRFLPEDREVGHLGLLNRDFPMGFLEQMGAPFTRDPNA